MNVRGGLCNKSTATENCASIFASVEMSRSKWVIGVHTPLADKIGLHTLDSGDVDALLRIIERLRKRVEEKIGLNASVLCCYEAGYEGFWTARNPRRRAAWCSRWSVPWPNSSAT
jgi:hypothetical protein